MNIDSYLNAQRRTKHREEFKTFDKCELLKMEDSELAAWQSRFTSEDAQWLLAEHEWKRRIGLPTRRIAFAALMISILSFLLSAWNVLQHH